MPAFAMMAESITSGTFWHSFDEPVGTVQSWLSLTAGAPVPLDHRLFATTELLHSDGQHGAVALRITNEGNDVVCGGLARCVLVGRTGDSLAEIKATMPMKTDNLVSTVVPLSILPPPIDASLDGRQILTAISEGAMSAGPLCKLLSAAVTSSDTQTRMTVSPQPWMANPLGAIQGGVIAAITGQACSFAGQLHTDPGQSYSWPTFRSTSSVPAVRGTDNRGDRPGPDRSSAGQGVGHHDQHRRSRIRPRHSQCQVRVSSVTDSRGCPQCTRHRSTH